MTSLIDDLFSLAELQIINLDKDFDRKKYLKSMPDLVSIYAWEDDVNSLKLPKLAVYDGKKKIYTISGNLDFINYIITKNLITHCVKKVLKLLFKQNLRTENFKIGCTQLIDNSINNTIASASQRDLLDLIKNYLEIDTNYYDIGKNNNEHLAAFYCYVIFNIYKKQKEILRINKKATELYSRMLKAIPCIARMELNGLPLNCKNYSDKCTDWQKNRIHARKEFRTITGFLPGNLKLLEEYYKNNISKDEAIVLYKNNKFSSSKKILKKIKHPSIKPLIIYRENDYLNNHFGANTEFHNSVDLKNGRVYTNYITPGSDTGRIQSSSPNLQGIPKSIGMRDLFEAPKDYILIAADYSIFETRILAYELEEENLIKSLEEDKDLHNETAETLNISRAKAKIINHSIPYGRGARSLSEELMCSLPEAQEYLNLYRIKYPTFAHAEKQLQQQAINEGGISLRGGRFRRLAKDESYKAISTLVQGTAADILFEALGAIPIWLQEHAVHTAHDEILLLVKNYDSDKAIKCIRNCMVRAFLKFYPNAKGQNIVTVKKGLCWATME